MITCEIPFNKFLLKNNTKKIGKYGNFYISPEAKSAQYALIIDLKMACKGHTLRDKEKVWINIFVEKPKNNIDCINLLDSIADCIKQAIGIDDKYFCISQIDYEIKKDGVIKIVIEQ